MTNNIQIKPDVDMNRAANFRTHNIERGKKLSMYGNYVEVFFYLFVSVVDSSGWNNCMIKMNEHKYNIQDPITLYTVADSLPLSCTSSLSQSCSPKFSPTFCLFILKKLKTVNYNIQKL